MIAICEELYLHASLVIIFFCVCKYGVTVYLFLDNNSYNRGDADLDQVFDSWVESNEYE